MPAPFVRETLIIRQGTTFERRWRITDPVTGMAKDLSEWSARAQVRATVSDSLTLHVWTGDAITCDAEGYVTLAVAPETSTDWSWRDGVYDVELVDPLGRVARIAEGSVRVSPEVTR